jgi:hypothetical protein
MEFIHFAVSLIALMEFRQRFGINRKVKTVIGQECLPAFCDDQGNGKIVVAGESSGAFCSCPLYSDSALDDSF